MDIKSKNNESKEADSKFQEKLNRIITSPTMFFLDSHGKSFNKKTIISITNRMIKLLKLTKSNTYSDFHAWNCILAYFNGVRDWDQLGGVNNPVYMKNILIADEKPLISSHCTPYIPKIILDFLKESENTLTLARLKNGMARLVYLSDMPFGAKGTIIAGAYKNLKGQFCYICEDGGHYYGVIKILEGNDNGVFMCYQWGNHNFIKV
jgi:hypothetical protein